MEESTRLRWINVGLALVHRPRCWTNVKQTLLQRRVSARSCCCFQLPWGEWLWFLERSCSSTANLRTLIWCPVSFCTRYGGLHSTLLSWSSDGPVLCWCRGGWPTIDLVVQSPPAGPMSGLAMQSALGWVISDNQNIHKLRVWSSKTAWRSTCGSWTRGSNPPQRLAAVTAYFTSKQLLLLASDLPRTGRQDRHR